jgi:hypothetical protein
LHILVINCSRSNKDEEEDAEEDVDEEEEDMKNFLAIRRRFGLEFVMP